MATTVIRKVNDLPDNALALLNHATFNNNFRYLQRLVERLESERLNCHLVSDCEQVVVTLQFILRAVLRAS